MARVQKGDFKLPLQDRQGDAEITAQYDAQGRDKGGKDEQMADVDTTSCAGRSDSYLAGICPL